MNMYTMLKQENAVTRTEILYADFCRNLKHILGREFDENGIAWDLFRDACSPSEAAGEMRATNTF